MGENLLVASFVRLISFLISSGRGLGRRPRFTTVDRGWIFNVSEQVPKLKNVSKSSFN